MDIWPNVILGFQEQDKGLKCWILKSGDF